MENFEQIEVKTVSPKIKAAAYLALVSGFLAARLLPVSENPLGTTAVTLLIYALTAAFILTEKGKKPLGTFVLPILGIALSAGGIVTSVPVLRSLIAIAQCILYVYWVYIALVGAGERFPGVNAIFELIKAACVMAIPSMGALWPAAFAKGKGKSKNSFGWILLGVLVAVIPTAIIVSLLSYDSAFTDLLGRLTRWNIFGSLAANIFALFLGIPLGMFLFALVYSCKNRLRCQLITPQTTENVMTRLRFAPATLAAAAMTPALIVYVIFFVSQIQNYCMAFGGQKPEGIIFSEYAREGFFELCAVAAINAGILLIANLFTRRARESAPMLRIYSGIYSVFTLVLIATALSKMVLYIDRFGLTRLRVLTSCFMVLLGLCFLAVLAAQLVRRLPLVGILASLAIITLGAVTCTDVDRVIADHNVNAYLAGELEKIDISHFYGLGYGAVPSALRLSEKADLPEYIRTELEDYIFATCENLSYEKETGTPAENLFALSIPRIRAEAALKAAGYQTEGLELEADFEEELW